ncbi:MAG: ImmA/IrrE family metallo-endopeptidase [Mariprofundales bacterium]
MFQEFTKIEAENIANKIRSAYWFDDKFPVDPVSIGKSLGIRIVDVNLSNDISGALLKRIGEDPIIMLHKNDPINRKRFTCAHELGHYISRAERKHFAEQAMGYVDKRSDLSASGSDPEEVSANRFAAALLMPEAKVKELYKKTPGDIYAMANFFKVSISAMSFRLKNLGF